MAKAPGKPNDPSQVPTRPPLAEAASQATAAGLSAGAPSAGAARPFDFLAPAQGPDELGRLGPYRVRQVLGHGGMGVVFLAEDLRLGRPVALKAMLPELAQKPGARERFLREARAVAAIEHDHIVAIFQVDEDRGVPYIAMPLLKGLSLDDWLTRQEQQGQRAPPKLAQVLKIGREIARGLAAAHERGLIHRDIKPANIWLDATAGGRVKLLDFGLARPTSGEQNLTQSGVIVGTPSYMAPEQAQGKKVDARADLFSLGVVLYRLCTGALPFVGADTISTLVAVAMTEPSAPVLVNPAVPGPLSDLVMKLLAKDPARRPASAQEVVNAILALEKTLTATPATDRTTVVPALVQAGAQAGAQALAAARRRRRTWLAAGVAVLLLVPVVFFAVSRLRVTTDKGEPSFVVAPTVVKPSAGTAPNVQPTTGKPAAVKPIEAWAPEKIIPDPVTPILEGHQGQIYQVRFLPDGKRAVSVAWDGHAHLWDVTTGKKLRSFASNGGDQILNCLAVAPDGKTLAVGGSVHRIYLWNLDTGARRHELLLSQAGMMSLAFTPNGAHLFAVTDHAGQVPQLVGFQVADGARLLDVPALKGGILPGALLSNGRRLRCGVAGTEAFLLWDIAKGIEVRRFADCAHGVLGQALFADGKRLATVHGDGSLRLWSLETGAELRRIHAHQGAAIRATGVHLLHNDRWLLTTGEDMAIRIWDTRTLSPLYEARADHLVTSQSAVSPDGRLLLTGAGWRLTARTEIDKDFRLRLWRLPLPPDARVAGAGP